MSLLPSTIPPPNEPIGTTESGEKVLLDKNFWLFLYNVALNSIAGTPDQFIEILNQSDLDASRVDSSVLPQQIANSVLLADQIQDVPASIANALLLADQVPDSASQASAIQSITVGSSPYTYIAAFNGTILVTGGTVSAIAIVRQSTSLATGLTSGLFPLSRLDQLVVTYSGTPTMKFLPQ